MVNVLNQISAELKEKNVLTMRGCKICPTKFSIGNWDSCWKCPESICVVPKLTFND